LKTSRLVAIALLAAALPVRAAEKVVAVTFDDLPAPVSGVPSNAILALRENTRKLLEAFKAHRIPVVGFVNEGKLSLDGEVAADFEARQDLLRMWLRAGLELGNHTFSHRSLNQTPLAEFENDLLRGEAVTRRLMLESGRTLRYFRHPFLHVGLDLGKRRAFEGFLAQRGYVVAPVTIDNDDYVFAAVYAAALRRDERGEAARVREAYLAYMDEVFAFIEAVSERLLGRQPRQTLLLHANALNADCFGRLADALEARGYRYATLEQALADPAYALPDSYVGAWGISWLHHWEITAGKPRSPSPDPPGWVQKAYDALQQR
jgi:peptidoglycan/xylan/chitin deacetylase (PgdA/CDA1 family)